jgi:hypothetical protein
MHGFGVLFQLLIFGYLFKPTAIAWFGVSGRGMKRAAFAELLLCVGLAAAASSLRALWM